MPPILIDPPTVLLAGVSAVAPQLLISGVLAAIGFTGGGVAYGSLAAMWMSSLGNVPAGSLFAALQSTGAIGLTGVLLSPAAIAFESATFFSVMYAMERYSVDASKITGFVSNSSAHIWDAQKTITEYAQDYLANHPDAGDKIHFYINSAEAHMSPYFSSINKQEIIDVVNKHSKEAIKVLDENTRIHRENFMKTTSSFLSTLSSQETADLVRKYSLEGADKAKLYTESAFNAASSYLSTINTQENIDFIHKKAQEAFHALDEQTRVHRENIVRNANSYFAGLFRQADSS